MENNNTVVVMMVKYIAGGKETVFYNTENGNCWMERQKNGETTTVKSYSVQSMVTV